MPQITASAAPSANPRHPQGKHDPQRCAIGGARLIKPSQQPQETAAPEISQKPAALVFTWPVNGAIIASFSVETLLYDETMLDWRTHEGIDLAAEEGTRVLLSPRGTVSQVYEDDLMGVTVVIDHGDGLESVYSNLAQAPDVAEGDSVYTGDIIGVVGEHCPGGERQGGPSALCHVPGRGAGGPGRISAGLLRQEKKACQPSGWYASFVFPGNWEKVTLFFGYDRVGSDGGAGHLATAWDDGSQ